jgi:ABC-type glycerol-3-phosphate transport system substrate-binding protein
MKPEITPSNDGLNMANHPRQRNAGPVAALSLIFALLALTSCASGLRGVDLPWQQNTPTLTPNTAVPQLTETPALTDASPSAPTPQTAPDSLVVWLPAEMDPTGKSQAASLLNARLAAFAESEGIRITVRLKSLSGSAGLLDTLTAASSAAPQALPDLILLPRRDLETAALKSLVMPLDALTSIVDDEDWFPYAHEMSLIQGVVYGIPFVGDPLALIARAGAESTLPAEWQAAAAPGSLFVFPADDPQALVPLTLYMALGGGVSGNQPRPNLDEETLVKMLTLLAEGRQSGSIRADVTQWQSFQQSWESFLEGGGDRTAAPLSLLLALYAQGTETPETLPKLLDTGFTLSSGWVWALSTADPDRGILAVRLAEYLVEPGFLGTWSEAFGRVPARPSALASWQNAALRPSLLQQSLSARFVPENNILTSIAPALRSAVLAVLRDNLSPEDAAKQAVESLK